jgi:hypothetical protein
MSPECHPSRHASITARVLTALQRIQFTVT